jgi:hypothetical protein
VFLGSNEEHWSESDNTTSTGGVELSGKETRSVGLDNSERNETSLQNAIGSLIVASSLESRFSGLRCIRVVVESASLSLCALLGKSSTADTLVTLLWPRLFLARALQFAE